MPPPQAEADDAYQPPEEEDDEYEDQAEYDDFGELITRRGAAATRRSTRTNGNRGSDWGDWKGERRSMRLGAPADVQLDGPPPKRARTNDSAVSGSSVDVAPANGNSSNGLKIKINGAAAVKSTETAVEAVAGKKKSKFWYYAVEPVSGPPPISAADEAPPTSDSAPQSEGSRADLDAMSDNPRGNGGNGNRNGLRYPSTTPSASGSNVDELYERSIGGSLSPASESMDES